MPDLVSLCLRYLMWIIGVSVLFLLAVNLAGLPLGPATQVILAAAPGLDIAARAIRGAGRVPPLADWARLTLALFAVYVAFEVGLIALIAPQILSAIVALEQGATAYLMTRASVLPMLALFLYLGVRTERARMSRG